LRFAYYRHVRVEQCNDEYKKKTFEAANEKQHWYWHESSWYWRGVNGYDGYGCNNGKCIPECRFYPEYGRIEDEEVIEDHNKLVESYRQKNAIVVPPSESELLRIAEMYRFH
jgi:hypothetical protein